jgi:hypothetical protein
MCARHGREYLGQSPWTDASNGAHLAALRMTGRIRGRGGVNATPSLTWAQSIRSLPLSSKTSPQKRNVLPAASTCVLSISALSMFAATAGMIPNKLRKVGSGADSPGGEAAHFILPSNATSEGHN